MNADRSRTLEQALPGLFVELAQARNPDYLEAAIERASDRPQRPAWTFPERWLPVDLVTTRVPAPRMPWRQVGVLALIALLIAALAATYIGSRPHVPAPFGAASNGLVAYDQGGDIYTVDPATGITTAVLTGPDADVTPAWSRDGTHFAFVRQRGGSSGLLYVARVDGTGLVQVTSEPRDRLANYSFSPDGREIMLTSGPELATELWVAKTDGSAIRRLDVGVSVDQARYRPPVGAEIVFTDRGPAEAGNALLAVDTATGQVRTILPAVPGLGRGWARVSPDGSRIAYGTSTLAPDRNSYSTHVVAADGSADVTLPMPTGATFQDAAEWSNDGKFLAIVRGYGLHNENMALAVLPADGSSAGIETARGLTGCCDTLLEWAPDDTVILVKPFDLNGQPLPPLLWNPLTGGTTPAPWTATSDPAWQRIAN